MENGIIHYIEKNYTNDKIDHIGYYIRSRIKESKQLSPEHKETLLNFPVIYIHTWTKDEKKYVYVGETINLVRRTDEHAESANADDQDYKWQEDWVKGENLTSVFFSHKEMNKSLTLDLEDSLIALFKADLGEDKVKNGRGNEYKGYSNCDLKKGFLYEIWNVLIKEGIAKKDIKELINNNQELDNKIQNKVKIENAPEFVIYNNQFTSYESLKCEIKNYLTSPGNQKIILEYPVVYLHVWKNNKGEYQAYVGEAFDIIQRTEQHYNYDEKKRGNYIDENLIFGNVENYKIENRWHKEWKESNYRYMFIFGSKHMNKSLTLDLENLLIKYLELCDIDGRNGRTNEQLEYCNREKLYPLFTKIVECLCGKNTIFSQKSLFINKTEIENKSSLLCSPFLDFSDEQRKIIKGVKDKILTDCEKNMNQSSHSLLIIHGGAGTGKTVIASTLFFDLYENKKTKFIVNSKELEEIYGSILSGKTLLGEKYKNIEKRIVSAQNHINEMQIAYMRIILKHILDSDEKIKELKCCETPLVGDKYNKSARPNRIKGKIQEFVEKFSIEKSDNESKTIDEKLIEECARVYSGYEIEGLFNSLKKKITNLEEPTDYDVVLIDEAHLMYAKGTQGTIKDAQLPFIVNHANITVLFYDEKQYVDTSAVVDASVTDPETRFKAIWKEKYCDNDISIELLSELDFQYRMHCSKCTEEWIKGLARENAKIEKKPLDEEKYEIKVFENVDELVDAIENKKNQKIIASLVATYNWNFNNGTKPFTIIKDSKYQFIWHGNPEKDIWTKKTSLLKNDFVEIGYYKDIQGLDLEYVGVIIGPSFSYSEGEGIKIDHECRPNTKNSNTGKENELIENELRVLLTRGVKGLYLFAVNDALRKKLLESTQ